MFIFIAVGLLGFGLGRELVGAESNIAGFKSPTGAWLLSSHGFLRNGDSRGGLLREGLGN
jgi:hypothetical protein